MTDALPFGFNAKSLDEFEAEVAPQLGSVVRSAFKGRFVHEFSGQRPTRDWLLKTVFLARTFCLVVGAPGCGKSFLLLDLVMSMALAVVDPTAPREWFGRKFKPCGVVYIAGEGQDDFIIRIQAWLLSKGLPLDTKLPVYLVPKAVDLRTSGDPAKALIAEVADVAAVMRAEWGCGPGVLIVDTFNKALAGGDDTKPEHVGALMKNCEAIREQTGAAVLAVHHTAKNATNRSPRGHGSITADNDGEIFVAEGDGPGAPNSWVVTRNKAGVKGDRFEFRLRSIEVGRDDDREPVTSCIVAPGGMVGSAEAYAMHDATEAAKTGKPNMTADGRLILMPNTLTAMRVLDKLLKVETANLDRPMPSPDVRAPHGTTAVTQEAWFEELVRGHPAYVEPNETNAAEVAKHRDKCRKIRDSAALKFQEKGLAGMDKGWIWRTSRRVAGIDRPEGDQFAPKASGPTMEQLGMTEEDVRVIF